MNKINYEEMIKCIINLEGIINYIANGNNPDFIIWKRTPEEFIEELEKIKNIIEKQQKEIEALELIHETYKEMIEENDYISKEKIRKQIRELEALDKQYYKKVIAVLEKILEE